MKPINKLTLSSVLAGAASVLLIIAGYLPTLSWSVAAVAGLFIAAVFIECGVIHALLCYTTVSVLSLIFCADKGVAFLFILLFGLYPIVKSFAETRRTMLLEYILKLLYCNSVIVIFYYMLLLFANLPELPDIPAVLPLSLLAANVVFLIYDFGFSKLVFFYRYLRERHRK